MEEVKYTIRRGEGLTEVQKVKALLRWIENFGSYRSGGSRYYNPYSEHFSEEKLNDHYYFIAFHREGCTEECCF